MVQKIDLVEFAEKYTNLKLTEIDKEFLILCQNEKLNLLLKKRVIYSQYPKYLNKFPKWMILK